MNAGIQPIIDNDMKIVPSKLNEREKVQQIEEKQCKLKTLKTKILQNVGHNFRALSNQSTSALINEMTDEQSNIDNNNSDAVKSNYSKTSNQTEGNNNANVVKTLKVSKDIKSAHTTTCHNNNGKVDKNSNSELIIAEAAKIILKNGLNGANAAAAAAVVLTAAANYQLPCGTIDVPSTSNLTTAAAAAAQAQLVAIAAAAAAVNATNKQNPLNSTLSSSPTQNDHSTITTTTTTTKTSTTSSTDVSTNKDIITTKCNNISNFTSNTSTTQYQFTKPAQLDEHNTNMSARDMGVIDYTIETTFNTEGVSNSKATTLSSTPVPVTHSSLSMQGNSNANFNEHNVSNNNGLELDIECGFDSKNRCDRSEERSPLSQYTVQHNCGFHSWNKYDLIGFNNNSYSHGGRLQFFKDGKFILELARAKDGEKSRWVYVPRKHFRPPSAATSSTITPCAAIFSGMAGAVPLSLPTSPITAAPVLAGSGSGFPKNECSNSLSFSDDNSSIQSSPWQRDHYYKKNAPQKNISKEMSLYYQRPNFKKLSPQALIKARKKFRKPYNMVTITHDLLYINMKQEIANDKKGEKMVKDPIKANEDIDNEMKNEPSTYMESNQSNVKTNKQISVHDEATEININNGRGDKEIDGVNNHDKKALANIECEANIQKIKNVDDLHSNMLSTQGQETVNKEQLVKTHRKLILPSKAKGKLLLIVQKLTDICKQRLSKNNAIANTTFIKTAPPSFGILVTKSTNNQSNIPTTTVSHNNNSNKVSPPSSNNTTASRLVDYHHQHVSPRKRILRELEKVSLEDNSIIGTAKRSRAKRGHNTCSMSTIATNGTNNSQTTFKPCNSAYQTKCTIQSSDSNSVSSSSYSEKFHTNLNNPSTTKVYSSYSIHSLLSSHGSSSSSSESGSSAKRRDSSPNTSSNTNSYQTHNTSQMQNPLYIIPKSPENYGTAGKSSNCTLNKAKTSSPYASPGRDNRSQSPFTIPTNNIVEYVNYGDRIPVAAHNNLRGIINSSEHRNNISPSYSHYLHHTPSIAHQQTYYSPYMTSSQNVPTPNKISPRNNASSPISPVSLSGASNNLSSHTSLSSPVSGSATQLTTIKCNTSNSAYVSPRSRSPHHHLSAFTSTPTNMANTCTTAYIPIQKDYSPTRLISYGASSRDNVPRTVPKKTASIRRQFASPTISYGSGDSNITTSCTTMPTTSNNFNNNDINSSSSGINNRNCSNENGCTNNINNGNSNHDRQVSVSLMQQQQQQPQQQYQQQAHMLPRSSPGANLASTACSSYTYPYQMYIPPPPSNTNGRHSPRNMSTAHNVTIPPPPLPLPPTSSYIPTVVGSPYYHPYISTLAAMRHPQIWMQHYQNATPTLLQSRHSPILLPSSRLASLPYHGFYYNGTMTNALAAAVAAATGFGSNTLTTTTSTSATANHLQTGLLPLVALPQNTDLFSHSNGSNFDNTNNVLMDITSANASPSSSACIIPNTLTSDHVATITTTTTTLTTKLTSIGNSLASLTSSPSLSLSLSTAAVPSIMTPSIGSHEMTSLYAYNRSSKDEQSSDVPLNLSKH